MLSKRYGSLSLLLFGGMFACSSDNSGLQTGLVESRNEPSGANCAFGGVALLRGTDSDGDGVLSPTEVSAIQYVCNGTSATSTLVSTVMVAPGVGGCPSGGVQLVRGPDANGNGVLDMNEITDTQTICGGSLTPQLVATVMLPVGDAKCANGGVAVNEGADANGNGVLDPAEVAKTAFVCNGGGPSSCAFPTNWNQTAAACEATTDWMNVDLSGRSLANSYLAGINLAGANLTTANLSWTELRGANLMGANLKNANLSQASVRGADFSKAVLDGANLSGVDLSDAILTGARGAGLAACPADLPGGWACVDLGAAGKTLLAPGSTLNGLDLTGANLSAANLNGVQATALLGCPAQLPPGWGCLEAGMAGKTLVGPGANLSGLNLASVSFASVLNLRDVSFKDAILTAATFGNATRLDDATFDGANLAGAMFGSSTDFSDSSFVGSKLTGVAIAAGSDFSGAVLRGADLSNTSLAGSDLAGVTATQLVSCPTALPIGWNCLELPSTGKTLVGPGANLSGLDLTGIDLSSRVLLNVDFRGANLTNANLSGANLQGSNMRNANLSGANLADANLQDVELAAATLQNARATGLQNCPDNLPDAWRCIQSHLVGPTAKLSGVNLAGSDLSGMNLSGIDLSGANLTAADLSDTNLSGANLANANLTEADLMRANLTNAAVTGAVSTGVIWDNTTCPNGTNSDAVGACF